MEPRYPGVEGDFVISSSSLNEYLKCGLLYFLGREQKGPRRITVALAIGIAVHEGAKFSLESEALDHGAILVAGDKYSQILEANECADLSRDQRAGRDAVLKAMTVFLSRVRPTLQPVAVEKKIAAKLPDGTVIVGTLDVVEADGFRDLKTGRRWTKDRADEARQFSIYALLYASEQGEPPRSIGVDTVYETPKGWSSETLWTYRSEQDLANVREVVSRARTGIEAGVALPAAEGSWWCSAKWCAHYGVDCPVTKGRRRE